MKASAIANSNIALVKYWGKRDKKLMLPQTGSLSMTVDGLQSHTTVEFDVKYDKDIFVLDDKEYSAGEEYEEVVNHLNLIREMSGRKEKAKVVSRNNYPTAAGLASSASGLAALSLAAARAAGLNLDKKELSILSRRGSGSASRSIAGGFVEWHRGEAENGKDSFAEQIFPQEHWPEFRLVVAVTSKKEKKIKSRAGMSKTVETCPYYKVWVNEIVPRDIETVKKALQERDFKTLGETAELNCLAMHATAMTTKPPIIYWNAGTMDVIHAVMNWRDEGMQCYFTIDGGPQVKVICLEKDADEITKRLKEFPNIEDIIITKPGGEAKIVEEHLF